MKTNRVILDESDSSSYTSTLLNKIREKYKTNKALQMSERTDNSERSQPQPQEVISNIQINNQNLSENIQGVEELENLAGNILHTPMHKTINVDFAFINTGKETKDETDLKDRQGSVNPFNPQRNSSAKIGRNTDMSAQSSLRAQREKNIFLNLLNLKMEKDNFTTEYFGEENPESHNKNEKFENKFLSLIEKSKKEENSKLVMPVCKVKKDDSPKRGMNPISKIFFPKPGDFPSQISFEEVEQEEDQTISNNEGQESCSYSSMGKSFYSESIYSIMSCSQCDCEECSDTCTCHEALYYEGIEKEINRREKDRIRQQELENTQLLSKKMLKLKLGTPKDFTEFGLTRSNVPLSPSNVTHALLPHRYKDDDKYKKRLFAYLRKPAFPRIRTDTMKFSSNQRKFSQAFDGNLTKFYDSIGMKRRMVSSEKKIFEAEHAFTDNRAVQPASGQLPPQYFKIYNDRDIGFPSRWQKQLRQSEMDDDVETDEDQLRAADRHIIKELGDGIRYYVKNKKNVRNLALLISSN